MWLPGALMSTISKRFLIMTCPAMKNIMCTGSAEPAGLVKPENPIPLYLDELSKLKGLERYINSKIMFLKPPTQLDLEEKRLNQIFDGIKTVITEGRITKHTGQIEKWIEEAAFPNEQGNSITTLDIAAALLKLTVGPGNTLETRDFIGNLQVPGRSFTGLKESKVS
jgi:hypothetical protein